MVETAIKRMSGALKNTEMSSTENTKSFTNYKNLLLVEQCKMQFYNFDAALSVSAPMGLRCVLQLYLINAGRTLDLLYFIRRTEAPK